MQTDMPLVSVGLPIYNRPEGLRRTLECFINQTYANIEIIIADNCSPDPEVEKIAREYVAKDDRISYFRHEENKGWGYNTNFVIEKAKGEYFLRATDDDWWHVTYVEKIMELMLKDDSIVVGMSNFSEVDIHGNKSKYHISNHLPLLLNFTTESHYINIRNYILQFEGFGKAMIYGAIVKIRFFKTKLVLNLIQKEFLAGDLLINLNTLLNGKLVVCPEILFKGTYDNERLYDTKVPVQKKVDLFFVVIDYGIIRDVFKKWNAYFYVQFKLISRSKMKFSNKIGIYSAIVKRILLFYYDLVCIGFRSRGIDIFRKLKRKHVLY